jgi:hypothetical protein
MLWAVADPTLNAFVGRTGARGQPWPHLQQVCRLERHRTLLRHGQVVRRAVEVTYAITSVPPARANAARLLRWLRGHWAIENRLHWVRDVTWDEDRSPVRTGAAPQAFAACRNLALALLRRRGYTNIAAALRTHAGRPQTAVHLVLSGGRS